MRIPDGLGLEWFEGAVLKKAMKEVKGKGRGKAEHNRLKKSCRRELYCTLGRQVVGYQLPDELCLLLLYSREV